MRKHLVFETVRSIVSPPPEEEGNANKESAVGESFASLTNFQHINNLSLAKLEYMKHLRRVVPYPCPGLLRQGFPG